jgi:hypothetical protein
VLGYAYAVVGESAKARKLIGELNVLAKQRYVSPFSTAIVHVGLGENDEAISLLDLAYQERSDTMAILKIYPLLDPIRSDPRFMELEKRVSYNP